MKIPRLLAVLIVVGAVIFGVFVWPMKDLPVEEVAKLKATTMLFGDTLKVKLYNGSSWRVKQVRMRVNICKTTAEILRDAPSTNQIFESSFGLKPEKGERVYDLKSKKTGKTHTVFLAIKHTPTKEDVDQALREFDTDEGVRTGGFDPDAYLRSNGVTPPPRKWSSELKLHSVLIDSVEGFPRVYAVNLFKGGEPLTVGEGTADLDFKHEGREWNCEVVGAKGFKP